MSATDTEPPDTDSKLTAGDLDADRRVLPSRTVLHLPEAYEYCTLAKRADIRPSKAGTRYTDEKICERCARFELEQRGVEQ
jgi:superfamily II helicase